MPRKITRAVAYYRTSSRTNAGPDKDSIKRQRAAVTSYAKTNKVRIVEEYNDPAISGTDPVQARPGFAALLDRIAGNGIDLLLVESPDRFARDLGVQIAGHDLLKTLGVELVPVSCPDHFREDTPTARLIRDVLGAVSQFDKAQTVAKLKAARDRKSQELGRYVAGRQPPPDETVALAKRLARKPRLGRRRSLRWIGEELARLGHTTMKGGEPTGNAYGPDAVARMLGRRK